MKILLDECVTKRLKGLLVDFNVSTVSENKWNGLRNGHLMKTAIENGFDVLITIDKNLIFQQNIKKADIIIVVFDSPTSNIADVGLFIPEFLIQIGTFTKGNAYLLNR